MDCVDTINFGNTCYDYILDVILKQIQDPFLQYTTFCYDAQSASARANADVVERAIDDLVRKGLARVCNIVPTVVNPLSVSIQNSGKKRLNLDLRAVNKHVLKQSVKFEDLRTAMQIFDKGHYLFKFDIHSAYHYIDIYEPHTQ